MPADAAVAATAVRPEPLARAGVLAVAVALAASLLVGVSGQWAAIGIADIQGGIGASADEASWLTTGYTMALFAGIVCSPPLIAAFGLSRYIASGALLVALAATACAAAPPLPAMIGLRALQGFAAGGFGPAAFVAIFVTMRGARLPLGLAMLALILLLPTTFGPASAGFIEAGFGWQALFLVQALIGGGLAGAAILLLPRPPVAWEALRKDWTGLLLLAAASAATLLVLAQGTRLYWLDSPVIIWSLAIAAGAWAGFIVTVARSPAPAIDRKLLVNPAFAVPISLNLLFRAGFAATAFLVPQFLVMIQGYRPLELAHLFLWAAIPQILAFPVAWWLLQRWDGRLVAGSGLLLFAAGALAASGVTGLWAGPEFEVPMALAGAGQVLFLVPALIAGGRVLTPPDGPTATLLFNGTTVGGTSIGVAIATELVTERQRFHAGALAESAAASAQPIGRIEELGAILLWRTGDEAAAGLRAIATVAGALRREAWVLSFADGFLVAGALLAATAAGLFLLKRQPPLRRPATQ